MWSRVLLEKVTLTTEGIYFKQLIAGELSIELFSMN